MYHYQPSIYPFPKSEAWKPCPSCRGYTVERQSCEVCNRTGYVQKSAQDRRQQGTKK